MGAWASNAWASGAWATGAWATDAGDVTAPTLVSATITAATTLTLVFSEAVQFGAGGNGGIALTMSGGAVTATYSAGAGSDTLTYSLSRSVTNAETGTIAYTQPGNGIEDAAGNDLATFSGTTVLFPATPVTGQRFRFNYDAPIMGRSTSKRFND